MSKITITNTIPKTKRPRKDDLRIDSVIVRWWTMKEFNASGKPNDKACSAFAYVSYALAMHSGAGTAHRRNEQFSSGGLFNIDCEMGDEYSSEIIAEQLDELRLHLGHFGIHPTDQEWNALVEAGRKASK